MNLTLKAITAAVLAFSLAACSSSPESTVKSFYSAIDKANMDAALATIDPASQKTWGGKLNSALAEQMKKADSCGGIKSVEITESSAKGDTWYGHALVTYNKETCKSSKSKYSVLKIDGKWLISPQ